MASEPNEKKLSSRECLLEAAAELFTSKGRDSVSTRELAERAGVNLGTIQYHFGSKSQLFIESVRHIFRIRRERAPLFQYERQDDSRSEVAFELTMFIYALLDDICHPQGPDVCKLIFREVLGATCEEPEIAETLVSSIADEFYRPVYDRLLDIVRLLAPETEEKTCWLRVHSIIGQCTFYVTSRPFVERLRRQDFTEEPLFSEVAEHIARFSLRNLGCGEDEIAAVLARAEEFKKGKTLL